MDMKAMARSKRSHTKHHQKPYRPKPLSTPSSSSTNDAKAAKQGDKKRFSQSNTLPSNWDRYSDSEDDDAALATDVVRPKSKGADFGFLISQAKSQSPANVSASFDDMLPDFSQELGSMMSVRGENILAWTGGDNFVLEDEATTSQEAQLFTLNLQTLAEELSRIDLAKRLFIEEDILPPELRVSHKFETKLESPDKHSNEPDGLVFQTSSELEKMTVNLEGQKSMGRAPESDLDMLLDSFVEPEPVSGSSTGARNFQNTLNKQESLSSSSPANDLDDAIDDLLNQTSEFTVQEEVTRPRVVSADSIDELLSSSVSQPKSKVMEDFDSWLDTI